MTEYTVKAVILSTKQLLNYDIKTARDGNTEYTHNDYKPGCTLIP